MPVPIRPRAAYMPSFSWLITAAVWNSWARCFRDEGVGAIEPLGVGQGFVGSALHDRAVRPTEGLGLLTPDAALIALHLAELAGRAGLLDDFQLPIGGQGRPSPGPDLQRSASRAGESPDPAC